MNSEWNEGQGEDAEIDPSVVPAFTFRALYSFVATRFLQAGDSPDSAIVHFGFLTATVAVLAVIALPSVWIIAPAVLFVVGGIYCSVKIAGHSKATAKVMSDSMSELEVFMALGEDQHHESFQSLKAVMQLKQTPKWLYSTSAYLLTGACALLLLANVGSKKLALQQQAGMARQVIGAYEALQDTLDEFQEALDSGLIDEPEDLPD